MESSARSLLACSVATDPELFGDLSKGLRTAMRLQSIATCPPLSETIDRGAVGLMDIGLNAALLRVLVLMAKADAVIAPEEQTMLQRICEEHLEGSHSHVWHDVASSAIDLKTAATAIPISERQSTLERAYLLISACGDEQGFPINPAELYAFNALVNHFDLTEDQKERSITAAKQRLNTRSDVWAMLRCKLSKTFGLSKNEDESKL